MNIFCHPEVMTSRQVQAMLGIELVTVLEFGSNQRTPLHGDRRDATEIDMKVPLRSCGIRFRGLLNTT
jgi:hypothetical protein